jgi:hypothetical protein
MFRTDERTYSQVQALAIEHRSTVSTVVEYLVRAQLQQKTPQNRANGSEAPHDARHVTTIIKPKNQA